MTQTQAAGPSTGPPVVDAETLRVVRPMVKGLLESSPGFCALPAEERRKIAEATVKVAGYMANPQGLAAQELSPQTGGLLRRPWEQPPAPAATAAAARPVARAQEEEEVDPVEKLKGRLADKPGFAGAEFRAGALREGTEQFGALVQKVDFPRFVSGLIQNVFQAIVDSSLQQMRAYGDLMANVAKSVDQFARDNITENNARDWLAQRFPEGLEVSTAPSEMAFEEGETPPAETPRLVATGEDAAATLQQISQELQLAKPVSDLSNADEESRLVMAARLQMARGRQQLLASMVMLGINRIVVTDGLIHAKVIFDMRAQDIARRRASASMFDEQKSKSSASMEASYGGWMSPWDASAKAATETEHVATVQSSVDETSESKAELKARLSGEVRVNFKSDYFPMEKLASPQMIAAIQGNAQPPEQPVARS